MSNVVYGRKVENFRNRIDVKLLSNEKRLFKMNINKTKLYVT